MSGEGRVSRASPGVPALRNCTRDEGGPFGFGDQEPISSHRKLLRAKAVVVSVAAIQANGCSGVERRPRSGHQAFLDFHDQLAPNPLCGWRRRPQLILHSVVLRRKSGPASNGTRDSVIFGLLVASNPEKRRR